MKPIVQNGSPSFSRRWTTRLAMAAALASLASCGGGGSSDTDVANTDDGTREHAQAMSMRDELSVVLPQTNDPLFQNLTIPADAATKGLWSSTKAWPMNGLHAVLLPDGKVLTYGTPKNTPATQDGRTFDLWTPSLGFDDASHATSYDATRVNSFCNSAAWLSDGRLMLTGGNSPLASSLVTASTGGAVTDTSMMADQRWYATMLTLPDGRSLIVGGMDPYQEGMVDKPDAAINAGTVSMTPEIYTVGTGWRSLTGARSREAFGPDYLRASYPRAWVAPNGRVFGISAETMWSLDPSANDGAGAVTVLGAFKGPANKAMPVNVGATSTAVMYASGKVLQVGGNGYFNGDGLPASNLATVVDINGAAPVVTETAPMSYARRYGNSVVLPNGQVLVTGGTTVGNSGNDAVYAAEIWDPAYGTWTLGASAAQIRVYHSATLLLPNGTVLSTGGGAPGPVNNMNAEVYYPPYLFKNIDGVTQLAPRPAMSSISALSFSHAGSVQIRMTDASPVTRLVLLANGTVTHSFNTTQRFQELSFTQDGDLLAATMPASASLAPPGYYQIVALNADGVPSRSVIVGLGLTGNLPLAQTDLPRNQALAFESVNATGQAIVTDSDGSGVLAAVPNTAAAPAAAQFWVRNGLADANCVSLESIASPGQWLRRQGLKVALGNSDGSAAFRSDATFCPEAGLSGLGVTLRSKARSDLVLRHRGAELSLEAVADDAVFRADASFAPRATVPRGVTFELGSVATSGSAVSVDAANLAVLAALGSPSTAATLAPAGYVARNGLADASCVSLESAAVPGKWLRHAGYRLQLSAYAATGVFLNDATFCPEPGVSGSGVSLRSKNFPARVMHHRDGQIWIDTQASDTAFTTSASFLSQQLSPATALPVLGPVAALPVSIGNSASWTPGLDAAGLEFSWDFGDGSSSPYSVSSSATHSYANPGLYLVTLTVRNAAGQSSTKSFMQAIYRGATANPSRASSAMLIEARNGASARLWVVNPDNDSVSVFDTGTNARVAEIATGSAPRTLALAPDGSVWVVNRDGASISIINAGTLAVTRTVALPRASQPYGIVFASAGTAYVSLEAAGRLLALDGSSAATLATLNVGTSPRHLSVSGDSKRVLVSRFVTPPLPGEGTAAVQPTIDGVQYGGEVVVVDATSMAVSSLVVLRHSGKTDTEISGSGVPNYLGAAVISPDGRSAWVPSKQDNLMRGLLRNGLSLDFQNTVRAISSRIDLGTLSEDYPARIDHDNAGVASAAAFDVTGAYLFVALETSRQVAVVDAIGGKELFRIEAGLAPQGLVVSADNTRLYVHNFLGRSVSVVDISALTTRGEFASTLLATVGSVSTEKLGATVLLGKQLFYDARDARLARDSYMSCASCHHDGTHDGRTWDIGAQGEGLRNTISLRGRAGMGHGRLHWSGNFDEVQDFEGQIRSLAGGTGLMSDTAFTTGTRNQPLGTAKAGVSTDLDALAAYVNSLSVMSQSAQRSSTGALTADAVAGRAVFAKQNCASCHGGTNFATSGLLLADVGTLKPTSGKRLGEVLRGIDVPTLRDVALTGPYLHDGSAAALGAAVTAHRGMAIGDADLGNLVTYLGQIGSEETVAPAALPAGAVQCAAEGRNCTLPVGTPATVYYGANGSYTSKGVVAGAIACNNASFGDPIFGTGKSCSYVAAVKCAAENATCTVPAGAMATVLYGAGGRYIARTVPGGTVLACNNANFTDPIFGSPKACWLR
jgi:YVTN family beta-propeller protein